MKMLFLQVEASDTVAALKKAIERDAKIEPGCQVLTYLGNRLDDTFTLGSYCIIDKATLHLEDARSPSGLDDMKNFHAPVFKCDGCNKEYSAKRSLLRHQRKKQHEKNPVIDFNY